MSTLAKQDPAELQQHQPPTVDPTIMWAIQNNASPEMLREMYQLQRDIRADQAKMAYNHAFGEFKAEPLVIAKRKQGAHANVMYAELHEVVAKITPALSRHDLSASWKLSKDDPAWMEVTCTIRHSQGHSESVSMGGAPDKGPGRNDIQARASTKTYLERYTLLAATGLAAGGTDNDGNGAPKVEKPGLPDEEIEKHLAAIKAATNPQELQQIWAEANRAARIAKDVPAAQEFANQGEKRKAELG